MIEEVDPRETDPNHPRRRHALAGHALAEERLLKAYLSGRLHHAWLFAGPRGIGKATAAYRFARFILANPDPERVKTARGLHVAPEHRAAKWLASGAHPDVFVLRRPWDREKEKIRKGIAIEDARAAAAFFEHTASQGGHRICIVDSADDLTGDAANTLLKTLEEPPARALLILVSGRPGRLLATVRSRTTVLPFSPLTEEDTLAVLRDLDTGENADRLADAARLSRGSPGRALDLLESKGAELFLRFSKLRAGGGRKDRAAELAIAEGFAGTGGTVEDSFRVFADLLLDWTGSEASARASAGQGAAMAQAHDAIAHSLRETHALNLDRRQTIVEAFAAIDAALGVSRVR